MKPKALILHAAGINRDIDAAYALELAGADVRITHVNELRKNRNMLSESRILVIPGGFSYADALGAGRLFALDIASFFREEVREFVEKGRPVIGICNGFQTLVKAGILPGIDVYPGTEEGARYATPSAVSNAGGSR
jgi:phosphoribosylformylglycinamidine (FGAM) synthase-like amidotransferase family enzyme